MKIRRKKRPLISKALAPEITSKQLNPHFSSHQENQAEVSADLGDNLQTQLQRAIASTHNIMEITNSIDRTSISNQNKIVQTLKEDRFGNKENQAAKILPLKSPSKEKKPRDGNFKSIGMAGFQGKYQPLFVEINDLEQGRVPNCYLLAKMAAKVRSNPDELEQYIKPKENGIYEVTIPVSSQPTKGQPVETIKTSITLTLDDILPASNFGKSAFAREGQINITDKTQLFLLLIEKAYATYKGTYDFNLWSNPHQAISQLTVNNSDTYNNNRFNEQQIANIINSALEKKLLVTTKTPTMAENTKERAASLNPGIIEKTNYIIKKVDPVSLTISLQNTSGSAPDINNLPISEFRKFFPDFKLKK